MYLNIAIDLLVDGVLSRLIVLSEQPTTTVRVEQQYNQL